MPQNIVQLNPPEQVDATTHSNHYGVFFPRKNKKPQISSLSREVRAMPTLKLRKAFHDKIIELNSTIKTREICDTTTLKTKKQQLSVPLLSRSDSFDLVLSPKFE